jgi:hypothetical protein
VKTGIAPVGIYMDGEPTPYRFWRPGSGPQHDLISGSTDSGKSRVLDQLLAYERHAKLETAPGVFENLMASIVIDPQNGQSVPEWKRNVGLFASGTEQGLMVLYRLREEMFTRNVLLSDTEWVDERGRTRYGVDHFDPLHPLIRSLGMKLWCVTVDEAHILLKIKEAAELVAELVAMFRKCGGKIRLVTQVPLLNSLGNKMEIRDAVAAGNVHVLRTANALSGQVAFNGAIPVKPNHLPREWPDGSTTAGIGFALGPAARPAMMRHYFVRDSYHWANTGETTPADWLVSEEQAYEARERATAKATPQRPAPRHAAPRPLAAVPTAKPVEARPGPPAAERDAVLAALRNGGRKRSEIMLACPGLSLGDVQQALDTFVAAGQVRVNADRGYELTGNGS